MAIDIGPGKDPKKLKFSPQPTNPLWDYFSQHDKGPGIFKWNHYFEVYHRHFARFRGKPVNLLEIGVYSGGSLGMWQNYFGEDCHIFGIDLKIACKSYETDSIHIYIGDQEDRGFWADFREDTPDIHILIDDGGHSAEQQITTLEEMLPHMPNGSVYVCEDIHGNPHRFAAYVTGLVHRLNSQGIEKTEHLSSEASSLQRSIHSIHFYPFLCVIEKHEQPPPYFECPKHGSEWQPFLDPN